MLIPKIVNWSGGKNITKLGQRRKSFIEGHMDTLHGFRIKFWEELGFRFRSEKDYDGYVKKVGYASYEPYTFSLYIGKHLTIAAVTNDETGDRENHGVFEDEAIEWFCRVSSEFHTATELLGKV